MSDVAELPEGAHETFQAVSPDEAAVRGCFIEHWLPAIAEDLDASEAYAASPEAPLVPYAGWLGMERRHDPMFARRINLRKLMAELYDCWHLIQTAPRVYHHITGGATDDSRASAEGIIAAADRRIEERERDLLAEVMAWRDRAEVAEAELRRLRGGAGPTTGDENETS